jgi:xylulose-5-phosphate/fructose-6-phosphate phosphoketolase
MDKALAAGPLSADELHKIHAYWRACNYIAAGMI